MKKGKVKKSLSLIVSSTIFLGLFSPYSAGMSVVNAGEIPPEGGEFSEVEGYEWVEQSIISDNGFEGDLSGWNISDECMAQDGGTKNSGDYALKTKWSESGAVDTSVTQEITLTKGWYYFTFAEEGESATSGLSVSIGESEVVCPATTGWNKWETYSSEKFFVSEEKECTVSIYGSVPAGYWGSIDDIVLYKYEEKKEMEERTFDIDSTPVNLDVVDSPLCCEKVDGLTNGFITGFDLSSYLSIRESGAKYKDFKGKELTDSQFFELLSDNGVNYVRIRVWVDPTDGNGNYYGGGNCTVDTAKVIGKYATDAGMKVLIDFHYSDFWTDPGKQTVPKAWKEKALDEKASTLKSWTETSLQEIIDAGVDVGMVQIGNETTTGFCGETSMNNMCTLFEAGSEGVRAVEDSNNMKIMIAIHLTNPDKINFTSYAKSLKDNGVVYDVFATSYYPYWHGTLENLKAKLSEVAGTYGKYVMVAETSYVRTLEDGDGWENTESEKKLESDKFPYEISEQGQVNHFRNVIETVADIDNGKGIGVFWWEPAWIPVQNWANAEDKDTVLVENKAIWEEKGSGWAASAAKDYDKDVKEWYGGSAVDNESVFDFDGKALESLKLYNLIKAGSTAKNSISMVKDISVSFEEGEKITLPDEVEILFKNGETNAAKVVWNSEDITEAENSGVGDYTIKGKVVYNEEEYDAICKLMIQRANLLRDYNFGFETGKADPWTITGSASNNEINKTDVRSGEYGYHFWNKEDFSCGIEQKITLGAGKYTFGGYIQGGDCGDSDIYIFAKLGEVEIKEGTELTGWNEWKNPEIELNVDRDGTEIIFGLNVTAAGGGWGTADDFYLYKTGEIVDNNNNGKDSNENGNNENGNNGKGNNVKDNNVKENNVKENNVKDDANKKTLPSGWVTDNTGTYYIYEDGTKASNEWIDGKWIGNDGKQTYEAEGKWMQDEGGWWYVDSSGWYPKNKWQKIDGKWYFFLESGYMDYSEYRDGCWLGEDGAWVEEYYGGHWMSDSTGWWYEDASGWYPVSRWVWIDGNCYYFEASGYMAVSKYIDGCWVGKDGAWVQ